MKNPLTIRNIVIPLKVFNQWTTEILNTSNCTVIPYPEEYDTLSKFVTSSRCQSFFSCLSSQPELARSMCNLSFSEAVKEDEQLNFNTYRHKNPFKLFGILNKQIENFEVEVKTAKNALKVVNRLIIANIEFIEYASKNDKDEFLKKEHEFDLFTSSKIKLILEKLLTS